jgi:cyclic-di-GMP phosphodiesterase, flagellum assembly factor TipF
MIRISTIFIALCMVLVSASVGIVLYTVTALRASESAIVALTVLTFLILYNAVSLRLRGGGNTEGQIADLSQGVADLARQVSDFGRRLAAAESKIASANSAGSDRTQSGLQSALGEINGWSSSLPPRSPPMTTC